MILSRRSPFGAGRQRCGARHKSACRALCKHSRHSGLAPARPFFVRFDASGKATKRHHCRPLWSTDPLAGPLRAGNVRGSISRVVMRSASHDDPALGVSSHDRFIFNVLRERPSDADRSYRIFTGAFTDTRFSRRAGVRLLRPLLSRGCTPCRLFRSRD